jgi:hypothetical protein
VQKHKFVAAVPAPMPWKASEKWRCAIRSSCSRTQTSTQELSLSKPMKPSKNFVAQSSGLSITEKTSSVNIKITGKKTSSTSVGGSNVTQALARALDLFDSGSSASDDEAAILAPPLKRPRKSTVPKNVPKSSGPSTTKGTFEVFLSRHLF